MNFYKYTPLSKTASVKVFDYPDKTLLKLISGEILLTTDREEMITEENAKNAYIQNLSDGLYYQVYKDLIYLYYRTRVPRARVIDLCKRGLKVFDKPNGSEVFKLGIDDIVFLNLTFKNDSENNIWTSVVYEDNGQYLDGYVVYKNIRNNFANLYIMDGKYHTVLTAGIIDNEKVNALKEDSGDAKEASTFALRANSRAGTTTTSSPKVKAKAKVQATPADIASKQAIKDAAKASAKSNRHLPKTERKHIKKIMKNHPDIVQNDSAFPPYVKQPDGTYTYDYTINVNKFKELNDLKKLREHNASEIRSIRKNVHYLGTHYNRFKIENPEDALSRGFVHIFFTRPDLNILEDDGTLLPMVNKDPLFRYSRKHRKLVLKQLVHDGVGFPHDFMWMLSNKAQSFTLTDENLDIESYGKTFHGYSIPIGRTTTASKTGGSFDISFTDTRDLDILRLHKLWIQYIHNVYTGKWTPRNKYIWQRIIDYACSVYVIITAEDFETILYWCKYYGVFPVNVPYSSLSWDGRLIASPKYNISYRYAWKDDYNPLNLMELNVNAFRNSHPKSVAYIPSYNPEIGRAGNTWVGVPFVETIKYSDRAPHNGTKMEMKLRFTTRTSKYAENREVD